MLNEWRAKLNEFETTTLQRLYDHWKNSGKWPKALPLAIKLRKNGDLYGLRDTLGYDIIQPGHSHQKDDVCKLTAVGVALCEDSKDDIDTFIKVIQHAVKNYIESPENEEITSDEIQSELGLSKLEVNKACQLIHEGCDIWTGAGFSKDSDYSFRIGYKCLKFEEVKSFEDYMKIQKISLPNRVSGKREQYPIEYVYEDVLPEDEIEPYEPIDISLITDSNIRYLVEGDLQELHYVLKVGAWKSATILSAIVAESILFDLLKNNDAIAQRNLGKKWPHSASLYDMALVASRANLISEPEHDLFKIIAVYRNQIHPNRAYHENRPEEYTANRLHEFVQKLIVDMRERTEKDIK